MSERVSMPALGESVTEGTVTRWLKNVGDTVEVDEPLLEVSTDKVDTEIPSPVAGVLLEILAQEDETVQVGADLAVVGDASESGGDGGSEESGSSEQEQPAEEPQQQEEEPQQQEEPAAEEEPAQEQPQQSSSGGGEVSGGETVTMPALGESVTEGTVTRWLKSEGDTVEVDEPLLEVSTDKVDTEIPSPVAGVLTKILVGEDEVVEVGGELAVIGGESSGGGSQESEPEQKSEPEPEPESQAPTEKPETKDAEGQDGGSADLAEEQTRHEEAAQQSAESEGTGSSTEPEPAVGLGSESEQTGSSSHKDVSTAVPAESQDVSAYVTPLVRKLAAQHGVDLGSLKGTGVGGRIRKQDVLDAAKAAQEPEAPAAEAAPASSAPEKAAAPAASESSSKRGTTEKMSRLRKVIAQRMVESLQTSAQLTTVLEVDVTKVSRLRKRVRDDFLKREGTKLSYLPFFAQAAIEALKQYPIVNSSVEDDTIVYHGSENLGVAVDTPRGLLVPVIKDAGDLNIAGLARKIADLAERTRDNKVGPDELSGATFTLTNTGSRGALFDTPIINQPNVAILGTGAVVKRPVVVTDEDGGETIAIRDMVYLALSYDHRVVDGADAARFLVAMKERLEDGTFDV
ncbi:2-oxoglutarate dehydrogenase, E2 component, dihydrolipoamide succinyltransferase [Ornithinimicrobium humiphilum]|uniref:Dihydrolipoamide acetyltransferase component of pyruvate dehydrogenase complex n=1 Tax=Ornithinimicrobium humiphilum TaxID=125288 RepID=A0A543KN00_9MICO|nr:2-oxoglutarate dehydrogenase, E2 component, dihydrolipoamide succinyltransferase [Ornithinimicrobium humiphilum]TQM96458.1 2-oxoglutarate dehydrogenase E2 component [Ornithinimicrobium humiphilum]